MTNTERTAKHRISKRVLIGAPLGIVALALLFLYETGAFTSGRIRPGRTPPPAREPPAGRIVTLQEHDVPLIHTTVGTLHSRDEIDVSSRILARIMDVRVRSGDRVKKGDVLAKLDDRELLASVGQARKHMEAAAARIESARERVLSDKSAMDLALTEQERMRTLFAGGAISKQRLDAAESAARQAAAARNRAIQDEHAATSEKAATAERLKQTEAALAYATITSPMDGIVAERLADPGDLASPGKILLRLFDPARLRLEVPLRESLVKTVKLGTQVHFTVPALGREFAGDIREIVPAVDPASRTFMVMVCVGEAPELMPGMFGTFHLRLGTEKAVLVPATAISRVGQLEYAVIVADKAMRRVLVRTAKGPGNMRKVISGLTPGMEILVPE